MFREFREFTDVRFITSCVLHSIDIQEVFMSFHLTYHCWIVSWCCRQLWDHQRSYHSRLKIHWTICPHCNTKCTQQWLPQHQERTLFGSFFFVYHHNFAVLLHNIHFHFSNQNYSSFKYNFCKFYRSSIWCNTCWCRSSSHSRCPHKTT